MPHDPDELARLLGQLSTFGPDEPYLVLADWLQRARDPWGELIALACASRADRTLLDAYTRLEATHGAHVCVLHGVPRRSVTFARGFVTLASFGTAGAVDVFAAEVRELFARPSSHFLEHFWAHGSCLTDDHVPALLEVGDRLRRVRNVLLFDNALSASAIAALKDRLPHAELADRYKTSRYEDNLSWSGPGYSEDLD